jgi:hypothetical protein
MGEGLLVLRGVAVHRVMALWSPVGEEPGGKLVLG